MCSIDGASDVTSSADADFAARLGMAIDELAAAASQQDDSAAAELAQRLARTWAMIAAADPDLAARTARYSA